MTDDRFQFRLWHLFVAATVIGAGCWFLTTVILPAMAVGSQRDLPGPERAVLARLRSNGLTVCDAFT